MKVEVLPIGLYQENCYVLHDNNHVLFIDPGRRAKEIAACVKENETVDAILLTHGHEDHTGAADDLADIFDCPVYMSLKDFVLVDPSHPLNHGYDAPVYHEILDLCGDMTIGAFRLHIIETPGHTAGSVCIQYRNLLFTGDTLFASSVGRTDLYSGDEEQMIETLKMLMGLDRSLKILPGHGPVSTLSRELASNPYLVCLSQA